MEKGPVSPKKGMVTEVQALHRAGRAAPKGSYPKGRKRPIQPIFRGGSDAFLMGGKTEEGSCKISGGKRFQSRSNLPRKEKKKRKKKTRLDVFAEESPEREPQVEGRRAVPFKRKGERSVVRRQEGGGGRRGKRGKKKALRKEKRHGF